MRYAFLGLCLILASCKACDEEAKTEHKPDAAPIETALPEAAAPAPRDAGPPVDAHVYDEIYGEAGTSSCRLAYGPAEQPFRGPAALDVNGAELRLIANEGGRPHVYPVPIPPKKTTVPKPPKPTSFIGMRWPPCELAGKYVYCEGNGGTISRTTIGPNNVPTAPQQIPHASIRTGTHLAAAMLDAEHSVVAYLDTRQTSEGNVLKAFAALDLNEPERISEDGAGATTLRFFARKSGPVAVYLDTRTNQVPMHARPLSFKNNKLALGTDVVLAVGGVPERGIDVQVTAIGERGFAFVPMPKDTLEFGMAVIPVEEPPKEDVGIEWSLYPNGLDPAPMAVTPAKDGKAAWIVRTRPREKAVGSPHILELGKIDGMGVYTTLGEIAVARNVSDITLLEDTPGSLWIVYGDNTVTYLERRVCE